MPSRNGAEARWDEGAEWLAKGRDEAMKANIADVNVGDVLVADGGFTCLREGQECEVIRLETGELAVHCDAGTHTLDGQVDSAKGGELVGLKKA